MRRKLPTLELVEFYINHTCNMDCTGCIYFNNYRFIGYQKWHDYADIYAEWSKKLDIDRWTILGGEPTLNKDLLLYIRGLKKLWPNSKCALITNGSFPSKFNKELYQALLESNMSVEIGLHNINRRQTVMDMITSWLIHPLSIERTPKNIRTLNGIDRNWKQSYNAIRDPNWPDCNTIDDWESLPQNIRNECETEHNFSPDILAADRSGYRIIDANGLVARIKPENFFYNTSLIELPKTNSFTLHNSDREKAHTACVSATCHQMKFGKLSKCGQSVLFQEFDKQFTLELNKEDRELMESFQPCSVTDDVAQYVKNIKKSIPQCKFCPEVFIQDEINSNIGKNKFGKKAHKYHNA